jgi:hypothetical protein
MTNNDSSERIDKLLQLHIDNIKQRYRKEIERAIEKIKNPRSEWDKWFRSQWHRAKWRRIKGYSRFAKKRANRHSGKLGGR